MSDHILHPSESGHRRTLLFGALLVAVVLILVTFFGIQALTTHQKTQYTTPNPPASQASNNSTLAVITNSGSTNLPGLSLTIHKDGSATVHYDKGRNQAASDRTFPAGTLDVAKLTALLNQIHDMNAIPDHSCLKSVSFGTTTTISYNGKTSGDLSCLTKQDGQAFGELRQVVQDMYAQLSSHRL